MTTGVPERDFEYTEHADVGRWREVTYATQWGDDYRENKEKEWEVHEGPSSRSWDRDDDPRD